MNNVFVKYMAIVGALALPGCDFKKEAEQPQGAQELPPLPVGVIDAQPVDLDVTADLPGRAEAFRQAEVRARVSGILLKRHYNEGQDVKEGDLLFTIDPAPYEAIRDACVAAVMRAEANLANAQDMEKRYGPLAEKGSISERHYTESVLQEKMAKAELAAARAELKTAELELGYTQVTAPISGRARSELVTEGALVGHGTPTPLTMIDQLDPIYVRFTQPVSELDAIKHGVRKDGWKQLDLQEASIKLVMSDGSVYKHQGKVVFSEIAVDPSTNTVQMKASFPNPDYEIMTGEYVHVVFDRAVRPSVFLIPQVALIRTMHGAMVMVVNKDGIVEMRPVQADEMDGENWVVTKGLQAGDKVIVEKSMMLVQPGSKVVIDKVLNQESQ